MRSLRLINVKAFQDTGDIQLAPITLFVGQNSCGKSSFIRFPVVLSQSFRNSGNSAICLHSNEPGSVDYGNFQDVLFQNQGDTFSFSFTQTYQDLREFIIVDLPEYDVPCMIRCTISFTKRKNRKASEIIISCITVDYNDEMAFMIKYTHGHYDVDIRKIIENGKMREHILFFSFKTKHPFTMDARVLVSRESEILKGIIDTYYDKNKEIYYAVTKRLNRERHSLSFDDYVQNPNDEKSYNLTENRYKEILEIYKAAKQVLNIQQNLTIFLYMGTRDMHYIGPFRNNPQRIYRLDETVKKTVGHSGEYASDMLINDYIDRGVLTKNVSRWFEEAFGYSIRVHELKSENVGTGYYQITLHETKEKKERNIMDVGYGISQVLPIVIQLAEATTKNRTERYHNRFSEFFVIEQPELHLHPAAQAKLASLFVNAIDNNSKQYRKILVETHSEHLIRALQVMIADPECFLSQDMVKIYYVDKKDANGSTIKEMKMTENGQFIDEWPSGFFDKSFELSRALLKAISMRRVNGD